MFSKILGISVLLVLLINTSFGLFITESSCVNLNENNFEGETVFDLYFNNCDGLNLKSNNCYINGAYNLTDKLSINFVSEKFDDSKTIYCQIIIEGQNLDDISSIQVSSENINVIRNFEKNYIQKKGCSEIGYFNSVSKIVLNDGGYFEGEIYYGSNEINILSSGQINLYSAKMICQEDFRVYNGAELKETIEIENKELFVNNVFTVKSILETFNNIALHNSVNYTFTINNTNAEFVKLPSICKVFKISGNTQISCNLENINDYNSINSFFDFNLKINSESKLKYTSKINYINFSGQLVSKVLNTGILNIVNLGNLNSIKEKQNLIFKTNAESKYLGELEYGDIINSVEITCPLTSSNVHLLIKNIPFGLSCSYFSNNYIRENIFYIDFTDQSYDLSIRGCTSPLVLNKPGLYDISYVCEGSNLCSGKCYSSIMYSSNSLNWINNLFFGRNVFSFYGDNSKADCICNNDLLLSPVHVSSDYYIDFGKLVDEIPIEVLS